MRWDRTQKPRGGNDAKAEAQESQDSVGRVEQEGAETTHHPPLQARRETGAGDSLTARRGTQAATAAQAKEMNSCASFTGDPTGSPLFLCRFLLYH